MASVKLATLAIRTIAKPISTQLKDQAKQHDRFRDFCVNLAQTMYRWEVRLRTNIMGEPAKHIRPLSETRAIENGANALAEGFLFAVAAGLILGETWRSSRNESKRRGDIDDQLDSLGTRVTELTTKMDQLSTLWDTELQEERQRNEELARILERVVEIGLRGGWAEFEDTPLRFPRIQLNPSRGQSNDSEPSLPTASPASPVPSSNTQTDKDHTRSKPNS